MSQASYSTSSLAGWQEHLSENFRDLREKKSRIGDAPIYALEHGLNPNEIQELIKDVKQAGLNPYALRRTPPLPWVVYAAEFGYGYDGKRYWDGFGPATPGWNVDFIQRKKDFLVRCFEQFQAEYGGIVPYGKWAENYRLIAWPITNSILPKFHQEQLAKVLWHARSRFSDKTFETPHSLGELIHNTSIQHGSYQFQDFSETTDLIGQIAIAILGAEFDSVQGILEPKILKRIQEDLYEVNQSRRWMDEARVRASKHLSKFKGFAAIGGRSRSNIKGEGEPEEPIAIDEDTKLQIEPKFFLKRVQTSRWELRLHIPELGPLANKFDGVAEAISSHRLLVKGADTRFLPPRGALLRKGYDVPILEWPGENDAMLALQGGPKIVQELLTYASRMEPAKTRLFKVSSRGTTADQLHSLHVIPGSRYVVLERTPANSPLSEWKEISVNCKGLAAFTFMVPNPIPSSLEDELQERGITVREDFELRTFGLSPIFNDGQIMELFSHEPNILQFRTNTSLDCVKFSLQSDPVISDSFPVDGGEWSFIKLPELEPGRYRLNIEMTSKADILNGHIDLVIKDVPLVTKVDGISLNQYTEVITEPSQPSLEDLWEGRLALEIRGPLGHIVECSVSLLDMDSNPILNPSVSLPPLHLPVLGPDWNEAFSRIVEDHHDSYDACEKVVLDFNIGELWKSTVECERLFTPVRWQTKRAQQAFRARLIDDSGVPGTQILCAQFATPAILEPFANPESIEDFAVVPSGLYVAISQGSHSSILSFPTKLLPQDLKLVPRIHKVPPSLEGIMGLLQTMAYWYTSSHSGHAIPSYWKKEVLRKFHSSIRESTLTAEFNSQLQRLVETPNLTLLNQLKAIYCSRIVKSASFADRLVSHAFSTKEHSPDDLITTLVDFLRTNKFFNWLKMEGETADWLTEFALRAANKPSSLHVWANSRMKAGIEEVFLKSRPLLHTAHLYEAAVNFARAGDATDKTSKMEARWEWT